FHLTGPSAEEFGSNGLPRAITSSLKDCSRLAHSGNPPNPIITKTTRETAQNPKNRLRLICLSGLRTRPHSENSAAMSSDLLGMAPLSVRPEVQRLSHPGADAPGEFMGDLTEPPRGNHASPPFPPHAVRPPIHQP